MPERCRQRRACATASAATYTVAAGDSWFSIATASGITTAALLNANGATASAALYPDDVLCLPNGVAAPAPSQGGCATNHVVERGDTWFDISRAAGVSLNGLLEANNATATTVIRPGDEVCLPAGATPTAGAAADTAVACVSERSVAAGESWYVISRSTGVPIDALVAANDASRSSPIHPGQTLCLPEVGFGRDLPSVVLDAAPVRGSVPVRQLVAGDPWRRPAPRGRRPHLARRHAGDRRRERHPDPPDDRRRTLGQRLVAHHGNGYVLLLRPPREFLGRVVGRLARAGRRRDRLRRIDRQRGVTSPAFRDPPGRRRTGQSVLGDLDGRRMHLRPPVRADPAVLMRHLAPDLDR